MPTPSVTGSAGAAGAIFCTDEVPFQARLLTSAPGWVSAAPLPTYFEPAFSCRSAIVAPSPFEPPTNSLFRSPEARSTLPDTVLKSL